MNKRAQGAISYLLLIGGAVLVAAIVIALVTSAPSEELLAGTTCSYHNTFGACNGDPNCQPVDVDGGDAGSAAEFFRCAAGAGGGADECIGEADDTPCTGGICCSETCTALACSGSGDCSDGDNRTQDICQNSGTCAAACSNPPVTECQDGDGCCPAGCTHVTDSDCAEAALVAWWKFDEGSGDNAFDSSGNGNNGTLEGSDGDPEWRSGNDCVSGSCLFFDNDQRHVEVPDDDTLGGMEDLTTNVLVKRIGNEYGDCLIGKWNMWGSYSLYFNTLRQANFFSRDSGNNYCSSPQRPKSSSLAEQWHMLTATSDGVNQKIYINGNLDISTDCQIDPIQENANKVFISCEDPNDDRRAFSGFIDDTAIYERVLQDWEICSICLHYAGLHADIDCGICDPTPP